MPKYKQEMNVNQGVIIGVSVGVAIGITIAVLTFIFIRLYRKRLHVAHRSSVRTDSSLAIRVNGAGTSIDFSASIADSEVVPNILPLGKRSNWKGYHDKDLSNSISGIPRYTYKDIQKATNNFTAIIGQGAFGPVYKAIMPAGEVVAIKVLASDSRQGEKEFQTEVLLLSRLHHRNLVNLVGYCVDKGSHMLIYEYMSNGSLARHLYSEKPCNLTWEERLQIALDVSHGIEYLHEGASPPVIHRDLKSANILLDRNMRAKVADFGLSKEEVFDGRKSGLKGTYGYMDPSYMSTSQLTTKSDIYSFGLILFELITAINPQHGLTEFIDMAAIGGEGGCSWEEILDKQLVDRCSDEEIREACHLATVAHKCLQSNPKQRPSIGEVTHAISRITQMQLANGSGPIFPGHGTLERIETQQVELSTIAYRGDRPSPKA